MVDNKKHKQDLVKSLNTTLDQKINEINKTIVDARESMANDTKSSAGDKFETGREMIQIEIDKSHAQLAKNHKLKKDIAQIDLGKVFNKIEFGSLVCTNQGNYFISVAMGLLELNNQSCFALSIASPIGQAFAGKQVGDLVSFQNRSYEILSVD